MFEHIQPLEIQRYVRLAQQKDVISFAAGLPDLSVMPLEQLKQCYASLMEVDYGSFQYKAPVESLKLKIQTMMAAQSVHCNQNEILITSGAQQAIYLASTLLLQPRTSLMIEAFAYPGFLQIANRLQMNFLPIPSLFNQGMDLDYLEKLASSSDAQPFLYIVSNGHNPLGYSMENDYRKKLAWLAEKYHFIIVEDDPYGYLNFTDEHFLPLRAYTNNAIYIGSFSKIVAPAVRTGWMVADQNIIEKLHQLKDMNDLYCSNPNHLALDALLTKHSLADLVRPQKLLYKKKLDCMITALDTYMQVPFRYALPKHGMFIWLEFLTPHFNLNHERVFDLAKTIYIPGSAFSVHKSSHSPMIRLNFTHTSFEEISTGIKNLNAAIKQCMQSG